MPALSPRLQRSVRLRLRRVSLFPDRRCHSTFKSAGTFNPMLFHVMQTTHARLAAAEPPHGRLRVAGLELGSLVSGGSTRLSQLAGPVL
jgi:hypothetical protein